MVICQLSRNPKVGFTSKEACVLLSQEEPVSECPKWKSSYLYARIFMTQCPWFQIFLLIIGCVVFGKPKTAVQAITGSGCTGRWEIMDARDGVGGKSGRRVCLRESRLHRRAKLGAPASRNLNLPDRRPNKRPKLPQAWSSHRRNP